MALKVTKRIINTKPLGKRWAKIVEEMVMKDGAKLARLELKGGRQTTQDQVVVQIPVTIYVGFSRRGKGIDGDTPTVQAVCKFTSSKSGSVCVCVGPGAKDCSCSDGGGGPIVA